MAVWSTAHVNPHGETRNFLAFMLGGAQNLRHLTIDNVHPDQFDVREFSAWIDQLVLLETLEVYMSLGLKGAVLERLITKIGPSLKNLKLYHCSRVTTQEFCWIARSCPNLERLEIPRTKAVTDDVIAAIASCCPHIKQLDVSGCNELSAQALHTIAKMRNLRGLRMIGLHGIVGNTRAMLDLIRAGVAITYYPSATQAVPAWLLQGSGSLRSLGNDNDISVDMSRPIGGSEGIGSTMSASTPEERINHAPDEQCNCARVECVDGCGSGIRRCMLLDHTEVCRSRPIMCPNSQYGCVHVTPRERMGSHLGECSAREHVISMMTDDDQSVITIEGDFTDSGTVSVRCGIVNERTRERDGHAVGGGGTHGGTGVGAGTCGGGAHVIIRRRSRCPLRSKGCDFVGDVAEHLPHCPKYAVVCPTCGRTFAGLGRLSEHACGGELRARRPSVELDGPALRSTFGFARDEHASAGSPSDEEEEDGDGDRNGDEDDGDSN
eukprot:Opistho-2@50764